MKYFLILLTVSLLFLNACDEDDMANAALNLTFTGLTDLGAASVYEGWIVVNGSPVSTGTFTVNGAGTPSQTEFNVDPADLAAATKFVLSVEPASDPDPAPSPLKILAGDFSGNAASLDMSIVADFSAISGKYILATPSSNGTDDELSGLWFLDNSSGSPAAGLALPDLSTVTGWTYEGWAVFPGASGPVSTGTFDNPAAMDDTGAGPYKGVDGNGPPFPGDDFVMGTAAGVTFPADLSGGKVVISVEPVPDNSADPFLIKPLVGDVPNSAADHTVYNIAANLITGTATR
jgi:hypothetical protein